MAGEKSLGIPQATLNLLVSTAGTLQSVMGSRAKYLAAKDAARRKESELMRQKQEEQRLAGERAELRMAQHMASVGAASALAGQGAAIANVGVIQQSYGFGTAMEATSDLNATSERLRQITMDVEQVKRNLNAARKQAAIDTWTGIMTGAMSFGTSVGALQGAVKVKRKAAENFAAEQRRIQNNASIANAVENAPSPAPFDSNAAMADILTENYFGG